MAIATPASASMRFFLDCSTLINLLYHISINEYNIYRQSTCIVLQFIPLQNIRNVLKIL